MTFDDAIHGLMSGDFSRLAPLFTSSVPAATCPIVQWFEEGRFRTEPAALAEAFTCACFNGRVDAVKRLLDAGVDASGGIGTGLNAFHWAVNRGQLAVVEILIRRGAPLEAKNAYGGTVLGCAVFSAVHEPRPDHARIIEALLKAGADVRAAAFPCGVADVDALLARYQVVAPPTGEVFR